MRRPAALAALVLVLAACGGASKASDSFTGPTIVTLPGSKPLERVTFDKSMYPEPGDECPETALGNKSVRKNDLAVEHMMTCRDVGGRFEWTP